MLDFSLFLQCILILSMAVIEYASLFLNFGVRFTNFHC